MSFLNPTLLIGLAAAVVPLVLHLLSRSRYRSVHWSAMMFLGGEETRTRQSTRLKQWVLLGLRMGTIGLLAVALARPIVQAQDSSRAARSPRTAAVILMDRSASMALNDNGRSRLEMAREAVFQILPGLSKGDDVWLVPMGEPVTGGPPHATDPQEIARRVKDLTPAAGMADVASSLREALHLLEGAGVARCEIYIVCDHQAASWAGVDSRFAAEFHELASQLASPPRVFVVPVGTDESENVAIESVEFVHSPVVADQPNQIEVKVRNYGAAPRAAAQVAVQRGAEKVSMPVNLPAGGTATVRLPVTVPEAGPPLLIADIDAGGLTFDKHFPLAFDVLHDLRVLIIDGDEHEGAFRSESDFLRLALAPYRARRKDLAVVDVISPDEAASADLSAYRVVILTNVPQLSEPQARAIEQFVYDGGGLLVAPGDRSRADNYNERLYRYGDGILPAELQPAVPESDATTTVGHIDLTHSVFAFLRNRPDSAPAAVVRRYFPVTPRDYDAAVLASYADGHPFLLEAPAGRGRVLLMTTSVDVDWNSLPLTNFFLPFAQSAVRYLAAGKSQKQNLGIGEPFAIELDEALDPKLLALQLPDRSYLDATALAVTQSGARTGVRFADTTAAGVYRLYRRKFEGKPLAVFVVNTPRAESDLAPVSAAEWKRLETSIGFGRVEAERRTIAAAQEVARSGWNLWLPLLAVAMMLSLAELAAARRWSRARE